MAMQESLDLKSAEISRISDNQCKQKNENANMKSKITDLEKELKSEQKQTKTKNNEIENLKK